MPPAPTRYLHNVISLGAQHQQTINKNIPPPI